MKNKPVIIDSPNSKKNAPKIFGNLCGTKPHSKPKDFDDFFKDSPRNASLFSNEVLSTLETYTNTYLCPDSSKSDNYTIIEDLKIILIKAKGLSVEKAIPWRSVPGIKSRYFKRLRNITNGEMKQIFKYLDEYGVENKTLIFNKTGGLQGIKDGDNMVVLDEDEEEILVPNEIIKEMEENKEGIMEEEEEISLKEDNSIKFEITDKNFKASSEQYHEISDNKEPEENFEEQEEEQVENSINSVEMEEKSHTIQEEIEEETMEKEVIAESHELPKEIHQEKTTDLNICCRTLGILLNLNNTNILPVLITKENEKINIADEKITIIKDFASNQREFIKGVNSEVVKILLDLKSAFQKNVRTIIQDLQRVSGNLDDLIEYYTDEENRENILWNGEEDSVLEEATTGKEKSMRMVIKYKGLQRVKNRMKFKGLKKNFEL